MRSRQNGSPSAPAHEVPTQGGERPRTRPPRRPRRSTPAKVAPPAPPARPDEAVLDGAFSRLFEALRKWRRDPKSDELTAELISAIDFRDAALDAVIEKDLELEDQAAAGEVAVAES